MPDRRRGARVEAYPLAVRPTQPRPGGRAELEPAKRAQLDATLRVLRNCVATLLVPGPLDPAGAGRPAGGSAIVAATGAIDRDGRGR